MRYGIIIIIIIIIIIMLDALKTLNLLDVNLEYFTDALLEVVDR
jgi:uncharacterized membrane protein